MTGQRWEDHTREHVLAPGGMTTATTGAAPRFATADRASPHAWLNGDLRGAVDQELLDERDELARPRAAWR